MMISHELPISYIAVAMPSGRLSLLNCSTMQASASSMSTRTISLTGVEKGSTRHTCHDTNPCMTSITVSAMMKNFAILMTVIGF